MPLMKQPQFLAMSRASLNVYLQGLHMGNASLMITRTYPDERRVGFHETPVKVVGSLVDESPFHQRRRGAPAFMRDLDGFYASVPAADCRKSNPLRARRLEKLNTAPRKYTRLSHFISKLWNSSHNAENLLFDRRPVGFIAIRNCSRDAGKICPHELSFQLRS